MLPSCLKMDIRKRGKKFLLKKVQEVRKYAGLDVHADGRITMGCTKILPEEFPVKCCTKFLPEEGMLENP